MGSFLYQELTENQLSNIISASLNSQVISYKLLTGGMFNTTYYVNTAEAGEVVLRVGPVNRHLLMPFEHHLMESEQMVYAYCLNYGVPSSQVLAVDTTKSLIDRDFMIVRYIPSCAMYGYELSPEDKVRICRDIGVATAKMHRITAPRFGRIVDVAKGGGFTSWSSFLYQELLDWEKVGIPANIFSREEHQQIRLLFLSATPYLDEIKEAHLVHTDLWFGNVLIRTDGERPEFAAIIDADRALWGDPMFEFSAIRWAYREDGFWDGYENKPSETVADQVRCGIYILLNRLWNSYVYLKEYDSPQNAQHERAEALGQIANLNRLLQ